MSRRQRWAPVRGTGNRIYEPRERLLVGALDLPGRALAGLLEAVGLRRVPALDPAAVRDVLVLRLDRIGDVLMSLPALAELREALPQARIRLAVGRWSESVARRAPVDEVLVWSAPWVGRPSEGSEPLAALLARARDLSPPDLALDLQGDVRASLLLHRSGARIRVGYANTGGSWLLTHVVPLDETVSFVEQNRLAVAVALGRAPSGEAALDHAPGVPAPRLALVAEADRARVREALGALPRPLVGVHPSGGRLVKQWPVERWREVAAQLQREHAASVVITGSAADADLARSLAAGLPGPVLDTTGRFTVIESLALISELDLFLSPDTGPMHMACAVGTKSVSVFGPSDSVRYFSGQAPRNVVVRRELWCAPCNQIRRPPAECAGPELPECLRLVTVDDVLRAARALL